MWCDLFVKAHSVQIWPLIFQIAVNVDLPNTLNYAISMCQNLTSMNHARNLRHFFECCRAMINRALLNYSEFSDSASRILRQQEHLEEIKCEKYHPDYHQPCAVVLRERASLNVENFVAEIRRKHPHIKLGRLFRNIPECRLDDPSGF